MSSVYTMIPRPIGEFAGLDMTTRYAFGLIYDRWLLSNRPDNKNRFTDTFGVYCYFSREALAMEMGVSLPTLRSAIKVLEKRGMIEIHRELGGGCRYYVTPHIQDHLEWLSLPF